MCYHIGSNAQLGCTGNLKKETLHSFERMHSPRKIKNLAENHQELIHDIREEHNIGMHVTGTGISPIQVDLSCRTSA